MKKYLIFLGAIMLLVFSANVVNAEGSVDDGADDVFHHYVSAGTGGWEGSATRTNIDIKEVSYAVDGAQLTLTLKVYGNIQNSENIYYWVSYNSTDAYYWFSWHDSNGTGLAMSTDVGGGLFDYNPTITASGDTIEGVFNVLGDTSNQVLYGYAHEYSEYGDTTKEWWADYAPGSYFPFIGLVNEDGTPISGGDTPPSGSGGTPGFELLTLVAAITIAIIILRKRK